MQEDAKDPNDNTSPSCPGGEWVSLNEVPDGLKIHQGSRLSLEQVKEVLKEADTIGNGQVNLGLGQAWVNFRRNHTSYGDVWLTNAAYLEIVGDK
jgi:hypothetical protein